jgi:hypothetical protein
MSKPKPKYLYRIEADLFGNGWRTLVGEQDGSLEYMRGRFDGFRESGGPRPAFRLVRFDPADPTAEPKVLDETKARSDLDVGMLPQAFGFQWGTYASAAAKALRTAAYDVRSAARNNPDLQDHEARLNALAAEVDALVTRGR